MSSLAQLVEQASGLDEVSGRKVAALIGSLVGDAASLHLEWVYDQDKLLGLVQEEEPEFWPDNQCPYFDLANGHLSCNGDLIWQSLKVVN